MSQEFFNFGFNEPLKEEDFIVSSSNFHAFSYIDKWPKWDSNILLIYGPKSSGKTMLAHIWQNKSRAKAISPEDIYSNNYSIAENYLLEDIERVHDEATLLHFFNSMKEAGKGHLLMSAKDHPLNLGVRLPDLRSRLNAIASAGLTDPDDDMLRAIFVKQFTDRQLRVEMDVINYLITRMERSFEALYQTVEQLDKQALKERKNITIPFARKVMENDKLVDA
jgi:chromosomal replication initiation ATPase DnaA